MKKLLMLVLVGVIIISGNQVWGQADANVDALQFPIVGVKVKDACNDELCGEGYNIHGTTYVPIRVVLESMGATVHWNNDPQTVEVVKNNNSDESQIDDPEMNK